MPQRASRTASSRPATRCCQVELSPSFAAVSTAAAALATCQAPMPVAEPFSVARRRRQRRRQTCRSVPSYATSGRSNKARTSRSSAAIVQRHAGQMHKINRALRRYNRRRRNGSQARWGRFDHKTASQSSSALIGRVWPGIGQKRGKNSLSGSHFSRPTVTVVNERRKARPVPTDFCAKIAQIAATQINDD